MRDLQDIRELINPEGITDGKIVAAQARFYDYCKMMNPKFYRDDRPYQRDLCETLQAIFEGRLINKDTGEPYKNLMINLPPRHGKSYTLTLFVQWCMGKKNDTRVISVSYNDILAGRFARNVRDGIDADKIDSKVTIFHDVFPTTRVKQGDAAAQLWSLEGQFFNYLATGFGGTIKNIGMGCGSRAGKTDQHSSGKPHVKEKLCRGCRRCQKECANGGLVFDEASRKMHVDAEHCVGCGRCLGACNFDAIEFDNNAANELLNCRMAEYTKAVVDGRPNFHISLVVDVSPNCDCHGENDVPILPNLGMFASFDPLALDQACVDACLAAAPMPGSQLAKHLADPDFHDHHDHFTNSTPESEWKSCLAHAEKIGLGSREYELISL